MFYTTIFPAKLITFFYLYLYKKIYTLNFNYFDFLLEDLKMCRRLFNCIRNEDEMILDFLIFKKKLAYFFSVDLSIGLLFFAV